MAIEIISQSLKDDIEIQKSTSKNKIWNFPGIQDEGSKKDLPDHTRIFGHESKCLISDFDNNKGTFQIFSENSESIAEVSLENLHNIYARKNGAQKEDCMEDSKKVSNEDSTEDSKKDLMGDSKKNSEEDSKAIKTGTTLIPKIQSISSLDDSKKDSREDIKEDSKEDSKKDSKEDSKEDSKGESKIGNSLPTSTNKDISDLASAIKIKVQQKSNGTNKKKWKKWNYIEFLSEALGKEPWLEIAHVNNPQLFQFNGQEIVNFLALNAKLDNECNPKRHSNNEKITPDDFEQNGKPSTDPYDISDVGKSENLEEPFLLLPKYLPKSGGAIQRTPYGRTCRDIPDYLHEVI